MMPEVTILRVLEKGVNTVGERPFRQPPLIPYLDEWCD